MIPLFQISNKSTILILISLLIGISGFVFRIVTVSRSNSGFNCRKQSEVRSLRVVWEKNSDGNGNGGNGVGDGGPKRYKVMGFVGIQTGFASVGRRRSLRQTWMPSDHQGLQQSVVYRLLVRRRPRRTISFKMHNVASSDKPGSPTSPIIDQP